MCNEFYLNYFDYFIFGEFVLDDFQADKKVPGDLEPAEYGINMTVGKNNIFNNYDWKLNFTKVSNLIICF